MTPSGIEPATFRLVAQYLNHCATISGPHISSYSAITESKGDLKNNDVGVYMNFVKISATEVALSGVNELYP
jgi:hypothetical protein